MAISRKITLSVSNTAAHRRKGYIVACLPLIVMIILVSVKPPFAQDGLILVTTVVSLVGISLSGLYYANKIVEAEVDDTHLYLKKGNAERRIPLREIVDVDYTNGRKFGKAKEEVIVITLQPHHAMGKTIVVLPDKSHNTLSKLLAKVTAVNRAAHL